VIEHDHKGASHPEENGRVEREGSRAPRGARTAVSSPSPVGPDAAEGPVFIADSDEVGGERGGGRGRGPGAGRRPSRISVWFGTSTS
jgi:hypothetical protein